MRRLHAFSLIELLVVLAVIALLMGLLLPALGAARGGARAVRCLANLRTIGQGVTMYAGDFRGHLPLSSHTTGNALDTGNWVYTLERYGVIPEARRCPDDPTPRSTSYVTNDYLEPGGGGYSRIDLIPRPTATAFAVEAHRSYTIDHLHAHLDGWTQPQQMLGQIDVNRHRGASNIVYLDGHAAPVSWQTIRATFGPDRSFLDPARAF
jgi:prepilin-type N-terminal cleavage/methylation domain-containing protein/prepilin-type processing-associated H-X9-DG protein